MGFFNLHVAVAIACCVSVFALLLIPLLNEKQNVSLELTIPQKDPDIHAFSIPQKRTFANRSQLSIQRLLEELTQEDDFESLFYKVDIVGELKQSVDGVRV